MASAIHLHDPAHPTFKKRQEEAAKSKAVTEKAAKLKSLQDKLAAETKPEEKAKIQAEINAL